MPNEWNGESGMWELNDPMKPTHVKGSTLNKFLPLPGTNIRDAWLPPINCSITDFEDREHMCPGADHQDEDPFYPASSYGFEIIADRFPVILPLRGKVKKPNLALVRCDWGGKPHRNGGSETAILRNTFKDAMLNFCAKSKRGIPPIY